MSLGELFVQLGVVGDASEVDDVIKKAKTQLELTKKQIDANEKLKNGAKKFEENYKFGKIQKQFSKFQAGFRAGISGKNGISGIVRGLSQGFKAAGAGAAGAALAVGAVVGVIAAFVIGAVKAYQALDRLTESLVNSNQQWVNFIHQTDLALNTLQGYAGVASLFDKSLGMEGAAGSIQALNDRLFELQLTGQGARGFQIGGINPVGQDAFGVLEQLRTRIKGLNNTQATYLLKQLGLDARLLPMLRMTGAEFERLRRIEERYMLTADQRLEIQRMNIQLELSKQKWQYLKDRAILAIMPHFVRLTKNLAFLVDIFLRGAKFIDDWNKKLHDTNTIIGKIITAISNIKAIFPNVFYPFKWFYVLFDDLEHYMNGGRSVLGVIVGQLSKLKQGLSLDDNIPAWLKMLVYAVDKLDKLLHWNSGKNPSSPTPTPDSGQNNVIGKTFGSLPFNPLNPFTVAKFLGKKVTENKTVNQYNNIYTTETAMSVDDSLRYAMGSWGSVYG